MLGDRSAPGLGALKSEQPHQRIQRHPQVSDVLLGPVPGIFVSADDAVDQKRRPLAPRNAVLAVAGVNSSVAVAKQGINFSMNSNTGSHRWVRDILQHVIQFTQCSRMSMVADRVHSSVSYFSARMC